MPSTICHAFSATIHSQQHHSQPSSPSSPSPPSPSTKTTTTDATITAVPYKTTKSAMHHFPPSLSHCQLVSQLPRLSSLDHAASGATSPLTPETSSKSETSTLSSSITTTTTTTTTNTLIPPSPLPSLPSCLNLPRSVRIVEVSPRDGLQNEPHIIDTVTKLELVNRLARAGMQHIELTSFVSPKWVPQLADATKLVTSIPSKLSQTCNFSALAPNMRGLNDFLSAYSSSSLSTLGEVAVFASATESFSKRNLNCGVNESLKRFYPVIKKALSNNLRVRAYISCIVVCPYEGHVEPNSVVRVAKALYSMGVDEISLADTIGAATPSSIVRVIDAVRQQTNIPPSKLAIHCHDTRGNALANVVAALSRGITVVDASVAGLGGCPFAPGAPGNVATEDVVVLLQTLGIHVGDHIDVEQLVDTGRFICKRVGRHPTSRIGDNVKNIDVDSLLQNVLEQLTMTKS